MLPVAAPPAPPAPMNAVSSADVNEGGMAASSGSIAMAMTGDSEDLHMPSICLDMEGEAPKWLTVGNWSVSNTAHLFHVFAKAKVLKFSINKDTCPSCAEVSAKFGMEWSMQLEKEGVDPNGDETLQLMTAEMNEVHKQIKLQCKLMKSADQEKAKMFIAENVAAARPDSELTEAEDDDDDNHDSIKDD